MTLLFPRSTRQPPGTSGCLQPKGRDRRLYRAVPGGEVTTVEGVAASDGTLNTVQQALHDCHGVQCRFCTPGIVMTLIALNTDAVREDLLWRGILPIIPPKANRREAIACDSRRYRDRNHVERLFNRLKQPRRIATRCDKTATSYLGFLCLAAAKLWLKYYVNMA